MSTTHPFRFDAEKALEVILYVSKRAGNPDIIHVCKILYFADKNHLEQFGRFICGDNYFAMNNGPVPSGTYDLIKDVQNPRRQSLWAEHVRRNFALRGWEIIPFRDADESLFSKSDIESLDWAIANYGGLPVKELIQKSHDDAYKAADLNGEIPVETIAKTLTNGELIIDHLKQSELEPA